MKIKPANHILADAMEWPDLTRIELWRAPVPTQAGQKTYVVVIRPTGAMTQHVVDDFAELALTPAISEAGTAVAGIEGLSPEQGKWVFRTLFTLRGAGYQDSSESADDTSASDANFIPLDTFVQRRKTQLWKTIGLTALMIVAFIYVLIVSPPPVFADADTRPSEKEVLLARVSALNSALQACKVLDQAEDRSSQPSLEAQNPAVDVLHLGQ